MSQTNTKLNLENLIRIRMNEIETQIKGNLSEFELGAIRQVENVKLLEGQSMVTLWQEGVFGYPVYLNLLKTSIAAQSWRNLNHIITILW